MLQQLVAWQARIGGASGHAGWSEQFVKEELNIIILVLTHVSFGRVED